jgi:cystathionine gamma-synthase
VLYGVLGVRGSDESLEGTPLERFDLSLEPELSFFMPNDPQDSPSTIAARAGLETDPGLGPPLMPAIYQTTVYAFPSLEALEGVYKGDHGYIYYRNGHPNGTALEDALARLENAEAACVAASGMAAILAGILSVCKNGDHIVADRNVYGGTFALLTDDLPRFGITATLVDADDLEALEAAIQPNTRVLHLESISNPTIRVADLPRLIALAKARGLIVGVDNTFASSVLIQPINHGADLVYHSLAKYANGHTTAMGGAVIGRRDLVELARTRLVHLGATISAFDAWLALHGLKTLHLRMRAHGENALTVARFLETHPKVRRVLYPGLPSHPHFERVTRLYPHGTGGMMSFELHGGYAAASAFVRALAGRIPLAPSLADVGTTLSYPAGTSHRALSPEARAEIGVTDGLLRLSVGIEDVQDIIRDLENALKTLEPEAVGAD